MLSAFYNLIFYEPLYNGLVFLVKAVPFHDLGFAIILLTVVVRLVLFPLNHRASITQRKMKEIGPEVDRVKKKFKDKKEEQAKQVMDLYRRHGIKPFSSFLTMLIQIPVLITIFIIIKKGVPFDDSVLYSFLGSSPHPNTLFLGFVDMLKPSYFLAILAGVSQFIQIKLATPKMVQSKGGKSFKDDLQKSLNVQMKYMMPLFIIFIATRFSAALPLYWTTSNVFAILHEIIVKREAEKLR